MCYASPPRRRMPARLAGRLKSSLAQWTENGPVRRRAEARLVVIGIAPSTRSCPSPLTASNRGSPHLPFQDHEGRKSRGHLHADPVQHWPDRIMQADADARSRREFQHRHAGPDSGPSDIRQDRVAGAAREEIASALHRRRCSPPAIRMPRSLAKLRSDLAVWGSKASSASGSSSQKVRRRRLPQHRSRHHGRQPRMAIDEQRGSGTDRFLHRLDPVDPCLEQPRAGRMIGSATSRARRTARS